MDALDWTVCNHSVGIKYHSSQAGAVQTVLMFCCVALAACTVGAWDQHRHTTDCLAPGILLSHYCSLRPIRLAVFQLLYLSSFIHLLPSIYSWKCFFYFFNGQLSLNFSLMYGCPCTYAGKQTKKFSFMYILHSYFTYYVKGN